MKKYDFDKLPKDGWCVDITIRHPRLEEFKDLFLTHYNTYYEWTSRWYGFSRKIGKPFSDGEDTRLFNNNIITIDEFFNLIDEKASPEWIPRVGELVLVSLDNVEWYENPESYFGFDSTNGYHVTFSNGYYHGRKFVKPYTDPDELRPRLDELVRDYAIKGIKLIATFENI